MEKKRLRVRRQKQSSLGSAYWLFVILSTQKKDHTILPTDETFPARVGDQGEFVKKKVRRGVVPRRVVKYILIVMD